MDRFTIVPFIKAVWTVSSALLGANREHDIAVFHKLDAILDESRIDTILNYSFFTERLGAEERELLYRFADALQCGETQYLHPVVKVRTAQLAQTMSELLRTVGSTFLPDDGTISRFRLNPTDPAAYDREWEKLHNGIETTWKAYRTYRQAVKARLNV